MGSLSINTRADLDSIAGTPEHAAFVAALKGSMTQRHNAAVYPDEYHRPGYAGPVVEPVWVDAEDLSTIEGFGFTREEIEAM